LTRGRVTPYKENHRDNNSVLEKKCGKHSDNFPEENPWFPCTDEFFYKDKNNKTEGLNTYCKKCTKFNAEEWRKNNPEKFIINYTKSNKSQRGVKTQRIGSAKRRVSGKQLEWQRSNPEKTKIYQEKRKLKEHKISKKEWNNLKLYFENTCAYCGLPIEEHFIARLGITKNGDFHKEHVDDEGANDLSNCIPACKTCNCSKHTATLDEWYNENNKVYTLERYNKIHKWIDEDYKDFMIEKKVRKERREDDRRYTLS